MKWFKMHVDVLNDRKVQTLPLDHFKAWFNMLCIASENPRRGYLPSIEDVAYLLRVDAAVAEASVEYLIRVGLFDREKDGAITPHGWAARQGKDSATSTDRVNKYRQRIRDNGEKVGGYAVHRAAVLARDGSACVYCGAAEKLVLDHLVPVSRGGDGLPDNLVAACKACNSGKAGRLVEETGYRFQRHATLLQYEAAKARFGIVTPPHLPPVTVTETVTKKSVTKSVTDLSPPVTPLEEIRGDEKRLEEKESPPNGVDSGAADDDEDMPELDRSYIASAARIGYQIVSRGHRTTIEHTRGLFGDAAATAVGHNGMRIHQQLGGEWKFFRAGAEKLKRSGKSKYDYVGAVLVDAKEYRSTGIPPPPVAIQGDPDAIAGRVYPSSPTVDPRTARKAQQLDGLFNRKTDTDRSTA